MRPLVLCRSPFCQTDSTVTGNATTNALVTGNGTFRFNGSTFTNNASVLVTFQFGGTTQSLLGSGIFNGNTATILSGSTTTLGIDKEMGAVTVNAGGTFNITNRTLFLSSAGTPLNVSGTLTITGSTVEYKGSSVKHCRRALPLITTLYPTAQTA